MRLKLIIGSVFLVACTEAPRMQPGQPVPESPDLAAPAGADLTGVSNPGVDLAPATISITNITPKVASTLGREQVTITGTGFDSRTEVAIGGIRAEIQSVTATQIIAFTPASPGAWGVPVVVSVRRVTDGATAVNSNVANSTSSFRYYASTLDFRERDSWSIISGGYTSHRFGLIGDLNNDNRPDLIITYASANYSSWINQGVGDMINQQNQNNGPNNPGTFKSVLADLDNDNFRDLVVIDEGSTWNYRLGNGNGNMDRGSQGSGSGNCNGRSLDFARVTGGDNFPEMLIACGGNSYLGLYTNTFGTNANVNSIFPGSPSQNLNMPGTNPYHALFVDLNKDGKMDVVGMNQNTSNQVLYWFHNNNDTIPSTATGSVGSNAANQNPQWMACADVNNDTYPDCVVTDLNTNTARVFLNDKAGALLNNNGTVPTGITPRGIILEDINGDLNLDMIVANANSHNFSVIPGRGDGTFGNIVGTDNRVLSARVNISLNCRFGWSVQAADIDGDGVKEISASCQNNVADDSVRGAVKIFKNVSR